MNRRTRPLITWMIVTLMALSGVMGALLLSANDADARGFRKSRFRSSRRSWGSSSRRRSTYKPKTRRARPSTKPRSRPSNYGRSKPSRRRTTGTRRSGSSRSRRSGSSTARRVYRATQARRIAPRSRSRRGTRYRNSGRRGARSGRSLAYNRAVSAGLAFATYTLARQHFANANRERYSAASSSEPAKRPSWVPAKTEVNGEQRPVVWSNELGSYGVKKHGKLVPYDVMKDKAATSTLMSTAGYYWGPKPARTSSSGSSGGGWFWLIALGVGAVVFLFLMVVAFFVLRAIKRSLMGPGKKGTKAVGKHRQPLLAPPGIRHDEPEHPDFWMQLSVGDFVVIHDFQAFEDALDGPKGVVYGDDFRVSSLVRLRSTTGTWDAVLTELEQMGQQPLHLLAWRERGYTQLSVYYAPTGFLPGSRTELLDRDEIWPFEEPTRDDWRPGELTFNREVTHVGTGADGKETEQAFALLPGGAAAASATREPTPKTLEAATLVRWRCDAAPQNPLMLILELGAGADMAGGHMRLLMGTPVDSHEVAITPGNIRVQ